MPRRESTPGRRVAALLAPIPIMAALVVARRRGWFDPFQEMPCAFPNVILWHLLASVGLRSLLAAYVAATGLWYFLLALASYAVVCGRDRMRPGVLMCMIAAAAVMAAAAYLFPRLGVA